MKNLASVKVVKTASYHYHYYPYYYYYFNIRVHKQPQLIYQVGHKSSSAATRTVKGKSLKMDLE